MSETGSSPKKNVGWSEGEKMSLLLQIIKQQGGGENMKVKWNEIHLPGRTPKSMTHVWAKIRQEANSFETGEAVTVTPRKRAAPKAAKGDGSESPTKKKAAPRKSKKAAAKEEQESDHEDEAKMTDLHDGSGDEIKAEDSPNEENYEDL